MKLVVATRSAQKVAEVRRILGAAGPGSPAVVSLDDAGIPWSERETSLEPHLSFEENARSKARHFARLSGLPTAADDSGLEVDALGGRPGVRSKRFAPARAHPALDRDEANNRHLLASLAGVPPERRGAKYVCVAWYEDPESGASAHFRGEAPGRILERARGGGGFGYDPLFLDVAAGRAYAELSPGEKDERSHRGRAFRALARFLAASEAPQP